VDQISNVETRPHFSPDPSITIASQALLRDMNFHHAKINLLINPQECDCSKLGDVVDRCIAHASENELLSFGVNFRALFEKLFLLFLQS
jgi:hypothetical protein